MAGRIANGLELTRQSWAALRQNPRLLLFPIIGVLGVTAMILLFAFPMVGLGAINALNANREPTGGEWAITALIVVPFYLINFFIVLYFNTALVAAALKVVRGEEATVADGLAMANKRLSKIFGYALISATVGVLASGGRGGGGRGAAAGQVAAAIFGALLRGAWTLMVFFAIPVIVAEDLGLVDSLKRSLQLFKTTWGEGFTGKAAIGIASVLAVLLVLVIGGGALAIGITQEILVLSVAGGAILVLGWALIGLANGAINGVLQASLYRYATTGNAGKYIDGGLARSAFSS